MEKEEKEAEANYNKLAEHYHHWRTEANPKGWLYNEMLEMPTTLKLIGNVKGKKVLDFGCGSGIYAEILSKKGAKVKGFDISKEMLKIAKENNPKLNLKLGSGYKIPFKEKFDIVYAALVMDYLKDWDKVFREVKKVLKGGGFFIFSQGNPVSEMTSKVKLGKKKYKVLGVEDYFKENKIYATWNVNDGKHKFKLRMSTHHKTYGTIIKTIVKNGFEIVDYKDAFPLKKAKKLFPEDYDYTSKVPFFCTWKVKLK